MANPLEFIFPRIKEERRFAGKDQAEANSPGTIPEPPPIIGAGKNKVILAIEGTSLLATGTAIYLQGYKEGIKTVARGALTGLVGSTAKQIAFGQGPFLIGPLNELIEEFGDKVSGEGNLPRPHRPVIDLEGPARSLIALLGFLPGTADAASKKSREILMRDLQPQVDELIRNAEADAASTQLSGIDKIQQLVHDFNRTLDFIKAGGNPDQLTKLALGIDFTIVQLWDSLSKADRAKVIEWLKSPDPFDTHRYGPFVKFILTNGKDGIPSLTPNRGDP